MSCKKLINQITPSILAVIYLTAGLLIGGVMGGCTNPVQDTYGKGVEGGGRAINKANGVQNQIDDSTRQTQEQQKTLEDSSP